MNATISDRYELGDRLGSGGMSTVYRATDRDAPWQAIHIGQLLSDAMRCPDPHLSIASGWLIKRLAPDGARC